MIRIICSALLATALLSTARADLTIVQEVEGAGPKAQMTMKVKGDKARIEAAPGLTMIYDSKTGETLNIVDAQKAVMRTTAAQAKAAAAAMATAAGQKTDGTPQKPKVTPTGKKETINGYEAEEYVTDGPTYKVSYWIARNYPQADAILKQMQAMTPEALNTAGAAVAPDFRDFPGLPIRTNITAGNTKIVSTITAVKMDPIPESEFTVPAGYQEMKMPATSALPAANPDAAKAPKPSASPKR
ncbi:MAG: DUF4412 domain-containing protein [Chthoniobacterales bacterium]|nr:DUF4412 domain-containing protein [Chthoniobacterales bacterium]